MILQKVIERREQVLRYKTIYCTADGKNRQEENVIYSWWSQENLMSKIISLKGMNLDK